MSNTRRRFFSRVSAILMAGWPPAANQRRTRRVPPLSRPPGTPPAFGTSPDVGPPVSHCHLRRSRKAGAVRLSPAERETAAGNWRNSMAAVVRTPHRTAQVLSAVIGGARYALGSGIARATGPAPGATVSFAHAQTARSRFPPATGHRLRSAVAAFALDRNAPAHLGAPHAHLSGPPAAVRSQAALRHHPHARPGACRKPNRPTARSPPGTIAARCMAFRGARRIFSTPPALPPPTAPSRIATACPRKMPRW